MTAPAPRARTGPSPRPRASAWGVEGGELDEVAAGIRGWQTQFTQLDRGSCSGSFREAVLPSLHVLRTSFTTDVAVSSRARGVTDPFQVGFSSSVVWDGRPVWAEHLAVAARGNESTLVLPRDAVFYSVRMDRGRLHALSSALGGAEASLNWRREIRRVPAAVLRALRSELDALLECDPADQPDVVEALEAQVYDHVALALTAPVEPGRPSSETRRRVLRRAEEYMRAHARDRISLVDLCVAAGCSERTLRYVFHERYRVSPGAFLKRLRLQGLRRDLQDAAPRSTTVLDLALRWGFWHLGHLGRDYKAFFGETPAATLGRERELRPPSA